MANKKVVYRVLFLLFLLSLFFPLISAELEIEKEAIVDVVAPEINQPAIYRLEITNLGESDVFNIYSLVGVDIKPNETFSIEQGKTKIMEVELWPEQSVLDTSGTFNFIYKIRGEKMGIQDDVMLIKIINLKDALDINCYNINLDSEQAVIYVRNKGSLPFPEIKARFYSLFFDFSEIFSLDAYEKREFEIPLDREKIKGLVAGSYIISTDIETYNVKEKIENSFRFTEKEEIITREEKKGILIPTLIIEKINEGNLPTLVRVEIEKNVISRLFTSFNADPVKVERKGFVVNYVFQKEVGPAEIFKVKATTNWIYPLIIVAAVIAIGLLINRYTSTDVILKKRVAFAKTKGGEFALKINLIVKAKSFVEKIKLVDKIPSLMKVHKRFGVTEPDKIDERNRRLEWHIENLQEGEERIFSYVIYSKISPIGKFEIPSATALYEKDGKISESSSNKVFFITEPRGK